MGVDGYLIFRHSRFHFMQLRAESKAMKDLTTLTAPLLEEAHPASSGRQRLARTSELYLKSPHF